MSMRNRSIALLAALAAGTGGLVAAAQPAHAYNPGVDSLHFAAAEDHCAPDNALPCTPGAGTGDANVITIRQTDDGDGLAFDTVETTSALADHIWLAAEIGADCRAGYNLWHVGIGGGLEDGGGAWVAPEVYPWGWDGMAVSIPNANTMPNKLVAVDIPLSVVFTLDHGVASDAFESVDDLYAFGEDVIAQRVADGMDENAARALPFEVGTGIPLNATVICRGKGALHSKYYETVSTSVPVVIRFEGVEVHPGLQHQLGRPGRVAAADAVTGVDLVVLPDPDACAIHVSGTIAANADMTVTYRILDTYGQGSQLFQVDVAAGIPAFVSHEIAVPQPESLGWPSLTTEDAGGIGGYAVEDTDLVQGTFQLQVISPTALLSNIDGFSMEPCTPAPVVAIGGHRQDGQLLHRSPTHRG